MTEPRGNRSWPRRKEEEVDLDNGVTVSLWNFRRDRNQCGRDDVTTRQRTAGPFARKANVL